jgi:hypothetical protein
MFLAKAAYKSNKLIPAIQSLKILPAFYEIRFIIAFTTRLPLFPILSRLNPVHPTSILLYDPF